MGARITSATAPGPLGYCVSEHSLKAGPACLKNAHINIWKAVDTALVKTQVYSHPADITFNCTEARIISVYPMKRKINFYDLAVLE